MSRKTTKTKNSKSWIWLCGIVGICLISLIVVSLNSTRYASLNASRQSFTPYAPEFISTKYYPPVLKSLIVHPESETNYFDFILDLGNGESAGVKDRKSIAKKLTKYFFLGITLPSSDFWVNLNPTEPESTTSYHLSLTDIGKVLLDADLKLKQDAARYTDPRTELGRTYWSKLKEKLITQHLPTNQIPTGTRLWIVPGKIIAEEDGDTITILSAKLKVFLESEYLQDKSNIILASAQDATTQQIQECNAQAFKEVLLPAIEHDVNYDKSYAQLRQVYNSLILAACYRQKYWGKGGIYSQCVNQAYLDGLESQSPWEKQDFFQAYLKSFQQGEYSLYQREYDSTQVDMVNRHYFYGGVDWSEIFDNKDSIEIQKAGSPVSSESEDGPLSVRLTIVRNHKEMGFSFLNPQPEKDPWRGSIEEKQIDSSFALASKTDKQRIQTVDGAEETASSAMKKGGVDFTKVASSAVEGKTGGIDLTELDQSASSAMDNSIPSSSLVLPPSEEKYVRDRELKETYLEMLHGSNRLIGPEHEDFDKFVDLYQEARGILDRLLEKAGLNPELYRFYLVDTVTPNAAALRYYNVIFGNMGLLRMLMEKGASQDALAWVLSHEIMHILQCRREIDEGKIDESKGFIDIHAGDRAREYQADLDGLRLMDEAGFTVKDAPVFFRTMIEWMKLRNIENSAWGTHPDLEERLRKLEALIVDYHWNSYLNNPTPMTTTLAQARQRTRYRNFQDRVIHVTTAQALDKLLNEATSAEELQFALLVGYEMLPDRERHNSLSQLRTTFNRKLQEFTGNNQDRQVLYDYMGEEVYTMVSRTEDLSQRLASFRALAASLDYQTILAIIELGIPRLFAANIDVDKLDEDEKHREAESVLQHLSGSVYSLGGQRRQMPSDRFNMYGTGFLEVMVGHLISQIKDGQLPLSDAQRLLKGLLALRTQERFTKAVRGDIRINSNIYELVSVILNSDKYARAMTNDDIQLLIDIYERAGSYGTRFTTEGGAEDLYNFAQRTTQPARQTILNWALKGDKASSLRNEFIKRDIKEFADTGRGLFSQGSKGDYLEVLLQNEYIVNKYSEAFSQFLDQVAKNANNRELVSYHKKILAKFRQAQVNSDAGIFRTMWLSKVRRDSSVFQGDVFDNALIEAVDPAIRSMVRSARREIKPLLYVFALGGMVSDEQLRDFVFGALRVRERNDERMLDNAEIISLVRNARPKRSLFDENDLSERFNALAYEDQRAIIDRWNEINPESRINNVTDEEFLLLVTFFDNLRSNIGIRLVKEGSSTEEAEKAFGRYALPIYLQRFFNMIGHGVRLTERDVGFSDAAWRAFAGEVSRKGVSYAMDQSKYASQQRPRQVTRVSSEEVSIDDFYAIFGFLEKLPRSYEQAVEVVVNNIPPSVFRNFTLYLLFIDRVLAQETGFTSTIDNNFNLQRVQEHIASLDYLGRSSVMNSLEIIIPYIIEDKDMEDNNRAALAKYLGQRSFGKDKPDETGVRRRHSVEVASYDDATFSTPGGALAQLQIFLGKLADSELEAIVTSDSTDLASKRAAILRFYPNASTVRDRWLKLAIESVGSSSPISDIEEMLSLIKNQSLRDNLALQVLEQYRNEHPGLFVDLDSALTQIQRFFPKPSLLRDDILAETAQHLATTPEQFARVQALLLDPFQKIEQLSDKEEARVTLGHDVLHSYIKNRSAQEKAEFLLWVLGITERKPFFLIDFEYNFHINCDSLRDSFRARFNRYYPEAGRSQQKEFLAPFLYGEQGIFADEGVSREFLDHFFAGIISDGPNRNLLKAIYDAVFSKADALRKEEILLSLIWSLGQQRQEIIGDQRQVNSEIQEARATRYFLEALGLGGKKLAQVLSRYQAVSKVMREELAQVQDNARRLPKGVIFDLIKKLYGDFFDKFEAVYEPLGSASIKVVYRARLKDGRVVVIKIKRPEIKKRVNEDLVFLREVLEAVRPHLEADGVPMPRNLLNQIEAGIREELNFEQEAANQKELSQNLRNRAKARKALLRKAIFNQFVSKGRAKARSEFSFVVPNATEVSNDALMIEEFVEGIPLSDKEALKEAGIDIEDVEIAVALELLKQMVVDGFYHADPHPGNIFVSKDGKTIYLIDLGAATGISLRNLVRLSILYQAIDSGDVEAIIKLVKSFDPSIKESELRKEFNRIIQSRDTVVNKLLKVFHALDTSQTNVPTELLSIFRLFGAAGDLFETVTGEAESSEVKGASIGSKIGLNFKIFLSKVLPKEKGRTSSPVKKIAKVEPIRENRNILVKIRSDIGRLVEEPLLEACNIFYDKNIQTLSTSANKKDIETGEAYIIVNYDNLSNENKEIIRRYGEVLEYDGRQAVKILIPINVQTTVQEVSKKAVEIANSFKKQKMTWAITYTLEELRGIYSADDATIQDFIEEGYYYDNRHNVFYYSKEHYDKVATGDVYSVDSGDIKQKGEHKAGSSALIAPDQGRLTPKEPASSPFQSKSDQLGGVDFGGIEVEVIQK